METRFVPDTPGAWLGYDLGSLVLALPPEFRAAADAVAAMPRAGVAEVVAALRASGIADDAPFAVLVASADDIQLALRGPATVAADTELFTGLGAEPWLERVVTGPTVVRLTVPGGEWTLMPPTPRARVASSAPPVAPPSLFADDDTEIPGPEPAEAPCRAGTLLDEVVRPEAMPAGSRPSPVPSLELPDGSRESLDVVVYAGRAPTAPADAPGSRVLRIAGDGDISRDHVRVAVEGGTVVVTDLGSRNGTIVRIPGHAAQKLRAGEPTPVLVGTVIDLGGGVELTVREG